MLQESFFFLPSYKYGHLTRNFFCGTNIRRRRRGRRFPCFCRVLLRPQQSEFDTHYFDPTIPGDYFRCQLRLNRNTLSVPMNILRPRLKSQNVKRKKSFTELTGRFITRKTILFVVRKKSCSKAGRRHLWRFVSVDKFLSSQRQVGRTWHSQLRTGK